MGPQIHGDQIFTENASEPYEIGTPSGNFWGSVKKSLKVGRFAMGQKYHSDFRHANSDHAWFPEAQKGPPDFRHTNSDHAWFP